MFSVTPETTVAAPSQAARSRQTPTAQPSSAGDGFAALVDDNAAAAAEHERTSSDTSRGNTDDRQPRTGMVAGTKSRNDVPAKSSTAPTATSNQNTAPTDQAPTTQDPAQPTQVTTGILPAGKHVVITPGQSNSGTDQSSDDQTAPDSQTVLADPGANALVPTPVAVVIPTTAPSDTSGGPTGDDAVTPGVQGSAAGPTVIIPEDSLAAAAIANGAATAAATPAGTATPTTDANIAATAATTVIDPSTEAAAAPAMKPDLTAGSPVNADAAVTLAAAAPAAVATTTKSTTTPAAIDMADGTKAEANAPVITPAAAKPVPQADASPEPIAPDGDATKQTSKQDAVEAKTDAPADDATTRKPTEARDVRSAPTSHERTAPAPTLQPDPSLQAASNAPLPQQPQVQPVTNAPIPAAQLGVALAANMPVPLNGLAVDIALKAASGKSRFDIRLDPAELGRIDVRLDVDKHGNVTSHLTVEKPSTLDMLRKDAPQLQRALEDAGLKTGDSGLQFSLRDQSQSGQQNDSSANRNAHRLIISEDDAISAPIAGKTYSRMLGASSGVDIRV